MSQDKVSNFIIYGLVDPISKQLRYIGLSSRGLSRPNQHLDSKRIYRPDRKTGKQSHCQKWLQVLDKQGLKPEIMILEECNSKEALNEAEIFYIAYYKSIGANLTNHQLGGYVSRVGGWKWSTEQRLKHSVISKKRYLQNSSSIKKAINSRIRNKTQGTKIQDQNGTMYASILEASKLTNISINKINRQIKGLNTSIDNFTFTLLGDK